MDAFSKNNRGKERLGWLDFGKTMGILVVLLVHAECSLGLITFYGGMFYMPVFFVAAGYTYRCRKGESFRAFAGKKAKRLLMPYFEVSGFLWLFFWCKDSLLSGHPDDLKLLSLFGIFYSRNQMYTAACTNGNPVLLNMLNAPLWFLTAMFLTYIWYEVLNRSRRKYLLLALGVLLSVLWHYSTELLLPWSLEAVPYFACFLAAGEELREKKKEGLLGELWVLGLLLVTFLVSSQLNGTMNLSSGNYGHSMLLGLVSGLAGSLLIFAAGMCLERKCPRIVRVFSCVGQETLTILCWHMFLFMFIRTGADMAGFGSSFTKAVQVAGSLVLLTAFGNRYRYRRDQRS